MGRWLRDDIKKIKLTRKTFEIITVLIIAILGLSIFFIPFKSQGRLTYDNGKLIYRGELINYRMNGKGKLTYSNGDSYQGYFQNGLFNGYGTFTASKGWSYSGYFKKGQPNGKGKLTTVDGKVYQGNFKQGIYQKWE